VGVEGLAAYQGKSDIDSGGDVALTRYFAGASLTRVDPLSGLILGVRIGAGGTDYDFGGGVAPWGDIEDSRISLFLRARVGDRMSVIVAPSLRYASETGASRSDGQTEGVFAAVTWEVNESLTIGPGVGVFSRLEQDRQIFPILAIDWKITPKLLFSTGQGVGASRGPGLSLSYAVTDALRLGIAGRIENADFRLDNTGPAPGGVGEDNGLPLVATLSWDPSDKLSASAFAGVKYNGELVLRNAQGNVVSRQDYDTAPVVGGQVSIKF
jgi:hypothetical protein